ncbi:uncharacterized protein [Lolium perenne]|uniref:uncharacterized protein isoform X1 n=1 Tax=Lolium perenne TaxID=4522 RepID=UPI0021F68C9E|nr:uncharacterized protein LOC127311233 isoform X2 [Lolium perenne]
MTRRRSGRRAGRRVEAARREERFPAAPPHYGDVERRLVEEVLYLHSLWRSGPPTAALHPGGGSFATHVRADRRKRRRLERRAEPADPGPDWPLAPSPPASASPGPWPDAPSSSSPTQQPEPSPARLAQRAALRAAEEFFSGNASDSDDDDEEEGSESEDAGDAAEGFFVGLFERDAELRGYYERSYEEGEFVCIGCAGRKARRGRVRRFRDCVGLVQHARSATLCGRPRAHRALASAVCRVLGWDIERLPSIVIDPRGTLGQALLARESAAAAAAPAHETKENVDSMENGNEDAAKEEDGLGRKSSSSSAKEEDADIGVNDSPLRAGAATKEDADTMKSGTSSNGDDREAHEQENVTETAEKDDTDPLGSKDTPMELRKSVQEEEGAIDDKQEHAMSADDMGDICNVKVENNTSKEEAATENKHEHTNNVVGTGDGDIGSPGHNLIDSTKVYSCTHAIWTSRMEIID